MALVHSESQSGHVRGQQLVGVYSSRRVPVRVRGRRIFLFVCSVSHDVCVQVVSVCWTWFAGCDPLCDPNLSLRGLSRIQVLQSENRVATL